MLGCGAPPSMGAPAGALCTLCSAPMIWFVARASSRRKGYVPAPGLMFSPKVFPHTTGEKLSLFHNQTADTCENVGI